MVAPPAARHGASVEQLLFDSKTYTVATNQEAERAGGGIKRAWNKTEISAQEASGEAEFSVHVGDFRGGYGHSYLHDNEPPDVYETAHQWDLSALGKATTWGPMATCESFTTSDERGWIIYQDPFFYILKGRYSVKYRLEEGHGATLSIVEFQDFAALGSGFVVAGRPARFNGKWLVPLKNSSGTPQRFVELDTITDPQTTEVQTIVISGSPTGGTYTVTFNGQTSAGIAWDAVEATVQAALRLIPGLAKVTVVTTGSSPNFTHTVTMIAACGAIGTTSPPQMTSSVAGLTGGAPAIAHATPTPGTTDQWDQGPAAREALSFTNWSHPISGYTIVRADGNVVSIAAADPMTAGSWGAEYSVGDPDDPILEMEERGGLLYVGKRDGLYYFDETTTARKVPLGINDIVDSENFKGMKTSFGYLVMPHRTGLVRWRPGAQHMIGVEQEGALDGDLANGWGRTFSLAEYGKQMLAAVTDPYNGYGSLVSYTAPKMLPHMHANYSSSAAEAVIVASIENHPGVAFPATFPISWRWSWDQAAYAIVLFTDTNHEVVTARIFKLGRSGMNAANDPNVNKAVDDAELRTPRYVGPDLNLQKTWRTVEFWMQASVQTDHPGLEVRVSIDEEAEFNLQANAEAAAPVNFLELTDGAKSAYLPVDASAVGRSCQLRFVVPAVAGNESQVAIELRDIVLKGTFKPLMTEDITTVLLLGQRTREDGTFDRRMASTQKSDLEALAEPTAAPVSYADPWGGSGYCEIYSVQITELGSARNRDQQWLAIVKLRRSSFGS